MLILEELITKLLEMDAVFLAMRTRSRNGRRRKAAG
jgi:hypothetical protein